MSDAMKSGPHRAHGYVQRLRDLLGRQTRPCVQEQRVALLSRQGSDPGRESTDSGRRVQPSGGLLDPAARGHLSPPRSRFYRAPVTCFRDPVLRRDPGGDPQQPRARRLPRMIKRRPPPKGDQEGVAQRILGSISSEPSPQERLHRARMPIEDLSERVGRSLGASEDLAVAAHIRYSCSTRGPFKVFSNGGRRRSRRTDTE